MLLTTLFTHHRGMNEYPHFIYNGSSNYGYNCWFDQSEPSPMDGGFPLSGYAGMEDTMPSWSLGPTVNELRMFDPYMYQAAPFSPYSEWSGNQVCNLYISLLMPHLPIG